MVGGDRDSPADSYGFYPSSRLQSVPFKFKLQLKVQVDVEVEVEAAMKGAWAPTGSTGREATPTTLSGGWSVVKEGCRAPASAWCWEWVGAAAVGDLLGVGLGASVMVTRLAPEPGPCGWVPVPAVWECRTLLPPGLPSWRQKKTTHRPTPSATLRADTPR
jgi:hypothetical protein